MAAVEQLITDNLDIWSSAVKAKSSAGRGTSKKIELYGIKKLRELILELAVRGLLVPQDPNDAPASELLKAITAEKSRLVEAGKLRRFESLPPVGDEEKPFEVPEGWCWERLGNVGLTQTGGTPKKADADHYGDFLPFIKPGDITDGRINSYENDGLSEVGAKQLDRIAASDSVLMVCIGTIGKCARVDRAVSFNQQINSVTPYVRIGGYVEKVLQSSYFQRIALENSSSTTLAILNKGKWASIPFVIAPENEQRRIVAKVDELMALCDQLEQQQESSIGAHQTLVQTLLGALTKGCDREGFAAAWARIAEHFDTLFTTEWSIDQLKQTILQLAVMGKLVPQNPDDEPASELLKKIAAEKAKLIKEGKIKKQKPLPPISDEEKPFDLPKGWSYTRLDDICAWITSGSTPPKSDFHETNGVPYLKVYNIRNQNIDFEYRSQFVLPDCHEGRLKRSILYPGDVVMNIVGPPLGKVAIIPKTYPEWNCNQAIAFFRPIYSRVNSFLYTYLKAGIFLNYIELIGTAGQDNISVTKSRTIVFPFPPIEEQCRIVSKVDELMKLCDSLKTNLSIAQSTRLKFADILCKRALVSL
ncbi:type I restriction modification DNA specificity protein [Spongiibacter sp. IMCC21906]|uniref:restriction endonuclease subunit S n=1 Tax=Spongiibacter sp. IMCC21906 TaxID=1620392 RepID=UPI00062DD975|nr:restriction endonuclease subunit S [Spongiibacter sp. IMCC21906]AKH70228.1 type I restriction modification DNA specificity protein [Spongiibacter sp. IMCC21906]